MVDKYTKVYQFIFPKQIFDSRTMRWKLNYLQVEEYHQLWSMRVVSH